MAAGPGEVERSNAGRTSGRNQTSLPASLRFQSGISTVGKFCGFAAVGNRHLRPKCSSIKATEIICSQHISEKHGATTERIGQQWSPGLQVSAGRNHRVGTCRTGERKVKPITHISLTDVTIGEVQY